MKSKKEVRLEGLFAIYFAIGVFGIMALGEFLVGKGIPHPVIIELWPILRIPGYLSVPILLYFGVRQLITGKQILPTNDGDNE
jgi:hypothetical protein